MVDLIGYGLPVNFPGINLAVIFLFRKLKYQLF